MRMWGVEPVLLCNRHLCGEHVEMHMFIGTLKKNKSIQGYIDKGLVNPNRIKSRHDELVKEMKKRGFFHDSPIDHDCSDLPIYPLSLKHNRQELIRRCGLCRERMDQ